MRRIYETPTTSRAAQYAFALVSFLTAPIVETLLADGAPEEVHWHTTEDVEWHASEPIHWHTTEEVRS